MHISEFFFKRQTLFWCLITALLIGGIYAYIVMPKLEDPAVSIKEAVIITPYPGASAHEVELEVTSILEEELRTVSNISEIRTVSSENLSTINLALEFSVPVNEVEQRWDILRRKVGNAANRLPAGAMAPIVVDDFSDIYGMMYALTGEGYSYAELDKYARFIGRELLDVKGVRRVQYFGTWDECINITLPKEQIARTGIYPMQIMTTIDGQNQPVGATNYQSGDRNLRLTVDGKLKNDEDVKNLQIQLPGGQQVRLSDIASVSRNYTDPQTNGFWVNNKPAIAISVSMEPDVVVTTVGKRVEERLAELQYDLPIGLNYEAIYFQPTKVAEAINSFMWNLISSVVIVILVLIGTIGLRGGLIIGSGLLLTVLGTFPILLGCGGTLQRISLGAFIVAMGMLVDNAVVVLDGILVDRGKGLPPSVSLFRTAKNTAFPLLGATLIAIITFLPVFLSEDSAGEYARDLFLVLCISLLLSWVLALTQVPVFAKYFLPLRRKKEDGTEPRDPLDTRIHRFIRRSIKFFMRHRLSTLGVSIGCLLLAIIGMRYVKDLFFPDFDYNQLYIEYTLPIQTHPDRVKEDLKEITSWLLTQEDVQRVASSQGGTPSRYSLVRAVNSEGNHYGECIVDFPSYKEAFRMQKRIEKELRENYPDAYIRVRTYNFSISTSHTVEALFSGPDPMVLRELSRQAQDIMRASPFVDPYTVCENIPAKTNALYARYHPSSALHAGINRSDIANALQAAGDGLPVGLLYENDKSLLINLKVRNSDGSRIREIEDIPVWSMLPSLRTGELNPIKLLTASTNDITDDMFHSVPLSQATTTTERVWEEASVFRFNGQRSIEVQCDPVKDSTPAAVLNDIRKTINNIPLPDGYSLRWLGEQKLQEDAMAGIIGRAPLMTILILVILLLLFNNMRKTMLILFCLPFVLVGITPALILTGTPFTFMAIIGVMGLMGMMIKNSIVLVDEITRLTREGTQPYDAVINSTVSRSRPVIMASATTIVGMFPLITDPMYSSLAVSVMAGLTVGTIITLILVPVYYALFFHIKTPEDI